MITLKYCKDQAMTYVSHIDLLRHVERILRRSAMPIVYTQGYNPHMQLNLGPTLPLGVSSIAEYVTVDTTVPPAEFLARYNQAAPASLRGLAAWQVEKNPNLAGTVVAADYRIGAFCNDKSDQVRQLVDRNPYWVEYPSKKDEHAQKDIAPNLFAVRVEEDCIWLCLGAGNNSIKPHLVAQAIEREMGIGIDYDNIVRRAQYVRREGILTAVDDSLAMVAGEVAYV